MVIGRFRPKLTTTTLDVALLAILAVRLVFAAVIPLSEDEAYYRLWSTRLQLGYYDHPPMIAWWIAIGRAVAGDNALGVRLLPILANFLTAILLFDTLRGMGIGQRAGLRAGLWLNATLLLGLGAILAIPDAPTMLFWTAALWALSRATMERSRPTPVLHWWGLAGAAVGLAVLSKYSALFLAIGLLLWMCASRQNRRRLLTAGPWFAGVSAIVVLAPHLYWNATHGWASVVKQFARVEPRSFAPEHLLEFIAGQFLLLNPFIAIFVIAALVGARRSPSQRLTGLLWMSSLPFLVYLAAHALHDPVQAHWPAPVYPALVGLAAIAAEFAPRNRPFGEFARRSAPWFGLGLSATALVLAVSPSLDGVSGAAMRPLRGWPRLAQTLSDQTASAKSPNAAAWIGTGSYGLAAQLAAERGLSIPIVQLNDRARYDVLPPQPKPDFSRPGLVIDLPRRMTAEALALCFEEVAPLTPLRRSGGVEGALHVEYAVFRVARPIKIISGGCWRERDLTPGR